MHGEKIIDMDLLTGLTIYCFGIGTGYMFSEYKNRSIDEHKFSALQLEKEHIKSQLDIVMDINYNLRKEKHEK